MAVEAGSRIKIGLRNIQLHMEGNIMNVISDKIAYLPAVDDPLSADVYFIKGKANCYIYDVGNNEDSLHHINRIK